MCTTGYSLSGDSCVKSSDADNSDNNDNNTNDDDSAYIVRIFLFTLSFLDLNRFPSLPRHPNSMLIKKKQSYF